MTSSRRDTSQIATADPSASRSSALRLFSHFASSARELLSCASPEKAVAKLSPQSFYLALQSSGGDVAAELIALATKEQYAISLDFELWRRDEFEEERFWAWLAFIDEKDSLEPLIRFVRVVDPKLLGLIMARHVDVSIREDPNDPPPAPQSYTPDKGYTWLTLKVEDKDRHYLLGRLLAVMFETNAALFYQLAALPAVTTQLELEEESYQEQRKRLGAEGIPDHEASYSINRPANPDEVKALLRGGEKMAVDINETVSLLPVRLTGLDPLDALLGEFASSEDRRLSDYVERAFAVIFNSAVVFYGIGFNDPADVSSYLERIIGAVNIGLMAGMELGEVSARRVFDSLGIVGLYQLGLCELKELKTKASRILKNASLVDACSSASRAVLDFANEPFPVLPAFLGEMGEFVQEGGRLRGGFRPFSSLYEVRSVRKLLDENFSS